MAAGAVPPRVAILGDSITYAGQWAVRVESALRATPEFAEAEIVNFGLASETVSGLSEDGHAGGAFPRPCLHERLGRVLDQFKPTHVLACYGMNDGIYQAVDEARFAAFRDGAEALHAASRSAGAQLVFITPPLFQADDPAKDTRRYDAVLDHYAGWLTGQSKAGWQVVDIRPPLRAAVAAAKAADPAFIYAGDGIHPGPAGHRFIADAVCAGLWTLWRLPGAPEIAPDPALEILARRANLLKHAWLSKTGHLRPGVPAGLPLDSANPQAASQLIEYRTAVAPGSSR